MKNVLVIFEAKDDRVEGLALAFGLGAVQKKANIRLRHLNPTPDAQLAHQSYGTLQAADLRWAEGVGIFLEADDHPGLESLSAVLREFAAEQPAGQRWAYLFTDDPEAEEAVLKLLPGSFERLSDDAPARQATAQYTTAMGQRLAATAK